LLPVEPLRVPDVGCNNLPTFTTALFKISQNCYTTNNLTHKKTVWRWGGTQQKAFDELKRRFVEGPILVAADYMCPLPVESNASDLQQELYYQCYVRVRSGTYVHFYPKA